MAYTKKKKKKKRLTLMAVMNQLKPLIGYTQQKKKWGGGRVIQKCASRI